MLAPQVQPVMMCGVANFYIMPAYRGVLCTYVNYSKNLKNDNMINKRGCSVNGLSLTSICGLFQLINLHLK